MLNILGEKINLLDSKIIRCWHMKDHTLRYNDESQK